MFNERIAIRSIVEPKHDDRARGWPQRVRIAAPAICEPAHVAVRAVCEKLREPASCERSSVWGCDAERIEPMLVRGAHECGLDVIRIGQKSRSA